MAFEVPTRTHGEPEAYRGNFRFLPCIGLWPGQTGPIEFRVIAAGTTLDPPPLVVLGPAYHRIRSTPCYGGPHHNDYERNPARPPTADVAPAQPLDLRLKTQICARNLYQLSPTVYFYSLIVSDHMVNCAFNHVAIDVDDLDRAIQFYTDLFDMEHAPTPDFGSPYAWLQFGDQQLHLIERESEKSPHQHFALIVDDFTAVWNRAIERGVIGEDKGYIRALPNGVVQCYITDPTGNRVEFMWPDVETLPESIACHVDHVEAIAPTDAPAGATIAPNVTTFVE